MKQSAFPTLMWSLAAGLCLIAIMAGLSITGSPDLQRRIHHDMTRTQKLQSLRYSVDAFVRQQKRLPATLAEAQNTSTFPNRDGDLDPISHQPIGYHPGVSDYQLCTTFETSAKRLTDSEEAQQWVHPRGPACITINVKTLLTPAPLPRTRR